MEEKKYHIGINISEEGDFLEYIVKEFVKKHFLDDYVTTYTYEEAVEAVKKLNDQRLIQDF